MAKNNASKPHKSSSKKHSKGGKGGKLAQVASIILLVALVSFIAAYLYNNVSQQSRSSETPRNATLMSMPSQATEKTDLSKKTANPVKSNKSNVKGDTKTKNQPAQKPVSTTPVSLSSAYLSSLRAERDLRPRIVSEFRSQVIEHKGYVLSYNEDYKIPNWVMYELTMAETLGTLRRTNEFDVDPAVPHHKMAQLDDYRHSGFDRGHMAPNVDLNWDRQAQRECYYLSNMCPQTHEFNSGIWLDLEQKVREWAERDSAITIVCGPVLPKDAVQAQKMSRIGKGRVLVPDYFYKVILSPYGTEAKAIAFLMPHDIEAGGRKRLSSYAVPVDSVEALTGIDFFPSLPDKVENVVESSFVISKWFKGR